MYDTPPGRPDRPAPDAGPDDELVGELRELMGRAAAGLAPLPDLTEEAVRLGRRRRVRARAAVAGAVTGVLVIGGIGSALLSGALSVGGGLSDPASPSAGPAVAPSAAASSTPSAWASPVPEATSDAARRARTAKALTQVLGSLIGTVSPAEAGLFAGRIDGHTFPVTFQVRPGVDALVECPDPPETAVVCRTAWLPGRIEAQVVVAGGDLWGGRSVSVSYLYASHTVVLTVGPDTDAKVSPPVSADQLLAAAGTSALLSQAKYEIQAAEYEAEDAAGDGTDPTGEPSLTPPTAPDPAPTGLSSAEPSSVTDSSSTDSTSETGGSPR
ncbi:hypothetical protein [Streptomyces sp. SID12488]|uniref:hypothetical protein n=1 Tax=Streptomyces sp. SID12488 TaxID=2706040 RepID=UPI0013DCA8ED|nr:hypothetical protein [Streptomyces sp. SID12488]NEA62249.1 hypothetical protein [Streptomyces sp. SID12488]